jgi:basic membrane protein A
VLTSMVKRVDNAVYQIVKDKVESKFQGGIHVYGLENDGVGYAVDQYNKDLLAPDVIREVEASKQKIIGGQIQVTNAMEK